MPSVIAGLILAAGRGRRMGRTKPLLPWGASTVLAHVFDQLQPFCEAGIAVVVGHDADAVIAALGARPTLRVEVDPDDEQIASIQSGLEALTPNDALTHVLVHPCDHPHVVEDVVRMMIDDERAYRCAMMPTYAGRGGHPVLIPRRLWAPVMNWRGDGGLRAFWASQPTDVVRMPCEDPRVRTDLDTPDAYERERPGP